MLPDPAEATAGGQRDLDVEVENPRAATDWLIGHADPARLDAHIARLWPLYRRRGWFRETQAILTAALERNGVPVTQQARWHRLLGEACMQLGEVRHAHRNFERTLALLGSAAPASTLGWLDVLAAQALQRRLRRLRPGGFVERREDRRVRAAERAATCRHMGEACWVLEDRPALLPMALFGLNQAELAGRLDLTAETQVLVGMITGSAGLRRFSRRQVQARSAPRTERATPSPPAGPSSWAGCTGSGSATGRRWTPEPPPLWRPALQPCCTASPTRWRLSAPSAGQDRHDPVVHLWGLLILIESRLRVDAGDPATTEWLEEAEQLARQQVGTIDTVRAHLAAARFHLAGGRAADAWRATRTAAELAGPEPFYAPYTLEAHVGIPELCLALLQRGEPAGVDPAELRATAAIGLRRLRRYACSIPMAQPRALACLGWSHWLQGHHGAAHRAWARAVREAERLAWA